MKLVDKEMEIILCSEKLQNNFYLQKKGHGRVIKNIYHVPSLSNLLIPLIVLLLIVEHIFVARKIAILF